MALEEATDAKIPFLGMDVDLTSPMAVVGVVISLVMGWTVFKMTEGVGANLADRVNSFIGNIVGVNPATGESSNLGGAFD